MGKKGAFSGAFFIWLATAELFLNKTSKRTYALFQADLMLEN